MNYEFFITGDGSPSICMWSDLWRPEAMHHRQGALAESLFVYEGVLAESLLLGVHPHILSVGIGCAYNELITVAHFLSRGDGFVPEDFYLESFEGDELLRTEFLKWLCGDASRRDHGCNGNDAAKNESNNLSIAQNLQSTYQNVCDLVAAHFQLDSHVLQTTLRELFENKKFKVREWLTAETKFDCNFGVIYFDAFSNKSTPELWDEKYIFNFLSNVANANCGFATYAATGALNRALRSAGFELRDQPGFAGKRESTRAFKMSVLV